MPTVLRVGPHRFFFYSKEGDEPAHIHVETAERVAKFWLNPVRLVYAKGYNQKELRQILKIVQTQESLFLARWKAYFES